MRFIPAPKTSNYDSYADFSYVVTFFEATPSCGGSMGAKGKGIGGMASEVYHPSIDSLSRYFSPSGLNGCSTASSSRRIN